MHKTLNLLRRILPGWVFQFQHYLEARLAQIIYKNPSQKIIIIGIVGSKGKTTTANLLWAILNKKEAPCGLIGTADIQIGDKKIKNHWHKTLPGRGVPQQLLSKMQKAGCKYAVLEVPSEAQQNFRHIGINFDLIIFTNVTNEILASHKNNLGLLHKHNKRLLTKLNSLKRKKIDGVQIPKTILANQEAQHFKDYFKFKADQKFSFSTQKNSTADFRAQNIKTTISTSNFTVQTPDQKEDFTINIPGQINVSNALAAISAAFLLDVKMSYAKRTLAKYQGVPGRMNFINQGQPFTVLIDYAHEESGLEHLLGWAKDSKLKKSSKIIVLICGQGGGRDTKKRPIMGQMSAQLADYVIVSNDDVYDDDPQTIIQDIINGAKKVRPKLNGIFNIEDRREGIAKALSLAGADDLVLITGKGTDTSTIIAGQKIPWDEFQVVQEELQKLGYKKP